MSDDVTILIPLHRSEPHVEVVDANLRRLVPRFRVVVSDATGEDDAFRRLRERWASHPSVEFVGPRPLEPGWVEHYNDLLGRCRTEWFMWLAHDDGIDADYVERCLTAARSVPGAVGAFGRIEPEIEPGVEYHEPVMCAPGVVRGGMEEALEALGEWSLPVAFRSVFRREGARPIAHTTIDDEWADLVWVFGRLVDGDLVHVDEAVYRKRFHATGAHTGWRAEVLGPLLAPFLTVELLRGAAGPAPRHALAAVSEWSAGHALRVMDRSRAEVAAQDERADALQAALVTEHSAVEELRVALADVGADRDDARRSLDALYTSTTWRIGAAAVAIVRFPGRLWGVLRPDRSRR